MEINIQAIAKRIITSKSVGRDVANRYNHFDKYRRLTGEFQWSNYIDSIRMSRIKFEQFMNQKLAASEQHKMLNLYVQYDHFIEAMEMATDHSRIHYIGNPVVAAFQEGHIAVNPLVDSSTELSHFIVTKVIDNGIEILNLYTNEVETITSDMLFGIWEIRMHSYNTFKAQE